MDPLFEATPSQAEVAQALEMWPELVGKRIRPLLVTAFGDIFVETSEGDVWVASPIELSCGPIAASTKDLERLFADPEWAQSRLMTDVAMAAREDGLERPPAQVFAIAPHPAVAGDDVAGELVPMSLRLCHHFALQVREQVDANG